MNTKAQMTIYIIIAFVLAFGIVFLITVRSLNTNEPLTIECFSDEDCRPSRCCAASLCVSQDNAPECDNVECEPGTYSGPPDFKLGSRIPGEERATCACVNQKCVAGN